MKQTSSTLPTTIGVALAVLIYALDSTVVATAAPTIVGEFRALNLYGWLFSAYLIPATATTLLYGRLADVFGRKRLFTIVMVGFMLSSVACGLSGSILQLIIARAWQGLFAGATFPLAVAIIADIYPIERRAQGFSIVPSTFAFASVLGPTVGGILTDSVGWRWIFFLNVPVTILAVGVLLATYSEGNRARRITLDQVDLPGAGLFAVGLALTLVGISLGSSAGSGGALTQIGFVLVGVLFLAAFVVRQRQTKYPLLPLRVLTHRGLGGALITIVLLIWIVYALLFFIPTLAQGVLGASARSAGIILIPLMLTWSVTALVSVRVGQRIGFRTVSLVGCVALAAALAVLSTVGPGNTPEALIVPMLLAGLGAGMINPNMMLLAQNSLSDRDQGLAGGLANCTLSLTGALIAPVLGSLEANRLVLHFGQQPANAALLLSPAGRSELAAKFSADYVHTLQLALGAALHDVFLVSFVALVLVIVWLALVVPDNANARRLRLAPLSR